MNIIKVTNFMIFLTIFFNFFNIYKLSQDCVNFVSNLYSNTQMGFLYAVLNIYVPLALLGYQSIAKFQSSSQISYGKWAIMVIAVYLFNWISWLFDQSYIVVFLDLLIKIALSFIPDAYNAKLQTIITNMHLQIWLDQFRCWLIAGLHKHYWKVTEYILAKMETDQSQQFREALLHDLKQQNTLRQNQFFIKPVKHFVNAAVNCDKINEQIAENISITAKKLEEYSKKIVQDKNLHNQTFGQIKPTKQVSYKPTSSVQSIKPVQFKDQQLPKFTYKKIQSEAKIIKELPQINLNLRASQQDIDFSDDEELKQKPHVISPINKKSHQNHVVFKAVPKRTHQLGIRNQSRLVGQMTEEAQQFKRTYTFTDHGVSQLSSHPQNFKKPYREDGQAFKEDLIGKLDLSSSEYSGMFDEEDDEDLRTLECKVEVILEIGSGQAARLEIYNLELYSNRDLKIISLYGRQFESHKLRAMRALANNYYELLFEEGKIGSRKCKFRGAHQAFMKYLGEK